jgi:Eukaryotic aspartyl protease
MQRIPISRPQMDNPKKDLGWAMLHEQRNRRLASLQRRQLLLPDDDNADADADEPMYYSRLPNYNCFDLMYTGTLRMGTPSQFFHVKLDTTTSVSWLPSVNCDQTCRFGHFEHYNPYTSTTYKGLDDASLPSTFREVYPNDYMAVVRGSVRRGFGTHRSRCVTHGSSLMFILWRSSHLYV